MSRTHKHDRCEPEEKPMDDTIKAIYDRQMDHLIDAVRRQEYLDNRMHPIVKLIHTEG